MKNCFKNEAGARIESYGRIAQWRRTQDRNAQGG